MTAGQRAGIWIVLCLIGGGACSFLTLEGVGIPYAIVFIVALGVLARRFDLLPESLAAFGLAFTLVAAWFAIPWLFRGDLGPAGYFAGVLVVGIVLTALSLVIRRPSSWFRR